MPNLAESKASLESGTSLSTVKLLLLGDTKAGKTHYAMQAALAGFNVLYLDGDVGIQTLMQLPPEALARVFYMPIGDRMGKDGSYEYRMAKFFVEFATSGVLTWNDTKGDIFDRKDYDQSFAETTHQDEVPVLTGGDVIWQIRPSQIGADTVVIMDSWTTLIQSLINWKADDLSIDLLEAEKHGREMYTGAGHKATQFLTLLRAFRCHVIVIGHPREYQKRSPPAGSRGQVAEKDMKLDWTKMVPISTSNPHSLTMGKHFSDIAWIEVTPSGKRNIDFRPALDRVIGGHFNEKKPVEELPFASLVKEVGGFIPDNPSTDRWLTRFGPGEFQPAGSKPAAVLTGSTPATATKVGGLAGMLNKQMGAKKA
jgi:hypothetical protein